MGMISNITKFGMLAAGGNMLLHSFMPQYGIDLTQYLPNQNNSQAAYVNAPVSGTTVQISNPLSSLVSSALQIIPNVLAQKGDYVVQSATPNNTQSKPTQQQAVSYNTPAKWYW